MANINVSIFKFIKKSICHKNNKLPLYLKYFAKTNNLIGLKIIKKYAIIHHKYIL